MDRFLQFLRFRKVVRFVPPLCILADLGCGSGDFLRYLKPRLARGYGFDAKVGRENEDNLFFIEANLDRKIPLDDASVDIVTSLAVLEHLGDPVAFVREVHRILRPQGSCIITTPSPPSKPLLEFLAYRLKIISGNDIRDHKRYFSRDDLIRLFEGFSEVRVRYFQLGLNTLLIAKKP